MTDIILSTQNGEPVASSRQIAESFGKEHKHVLESIKSISAENSALTHMFFPTTYTAGTGKYQFLAESCDSPTKRKAYEEFYNFLSALLEFAQETWQSEGGQSHDVKA